jgi:hypothetical protein
MSTHAVGDHAQVAAWDECPAILVNGSNSAFVGDAVGVKHASLIGQRQTANSLRCTSSHMILNAEVAEIAEITRNRNLNVLRDLRSRT